MKKIFLLIIGAYCLFSQTFEDLREEIKNTIEYKKELEKIEAKLLKKEADIFDREYEIGSSLSHAKSDDGSKGAEYSLYGGLNIALFDKDYLIIGLEKSKKIKLKSIQNSIQSRLWKLYGEYCINMEALQAKGELADIYDRITKIVDKGVRLGEFSASEVIMAHLSQESLNLEIISLDSHIAYIASQIKAIVPSFDKEFVCKDLKPDFNALFDIKNSALFELLKIDINNIKKQKELLKPLNLLRIEAEYSKEIDTKRATLNIAIPLNISSSAQKRRAALLKEQNSAILALKSLQQKYKEDKASLQKRLSLYSSMVSKSEKAMKLSANMLVKQSRLRFKAGEESLLSMLKAIETKIKIIENILQLKLKRHTSVAEFMQKYAIDTTEVIK